MKPPQTKYKNNDMDSFKFDYYFSDVYQRLMQLRKTTLRCVSEYYTPLWVSITLEYAITPAFEVYDNATASPNTSLVLRLSCIINSLFKVWVLLSQNLVQLFLQISITHRDVTNSTNCYTIIWPDQLNKMVHGFFGFY